jgi:hypothetical protein
MESVRNKTKKQIKQEKQPKWMINRPEKKQINKNKNKNRGRENSNATKNKKKGSIINKQCQGEREREV